MADLIIQPTRKWIRFQYTTVFVIFCIAVALYTNYLSDKNVTAWLLILPALLFLWPLAGSLRRRFTKITVTGDKLRYETGLLSKTIRTIQLSKVQDVRIDQTLSQRLMGIGTLSIETAGETSRLSMANIDQPRTVADHIVEASQDQQQQPKRKGERA